MNVQRLLSISFLLLVAAASGFAQVAGQFSGTVLDPSGAAVSNAHVDLTQVATNVHFSRMLT
jgi:hypothetical protein